MTLRMPYGGGIRAPEHHSESKEAFYAHEPGLKVVIPSTPRDAKGLLAAAIRDPDPVVFMEPKLIYRAFRDEVPDDEFTVPLGEATVRREGADVSVFTWGAMCRPTLEAAENLAEEGIDVEVVDLRTLKPMDTRNDRRLVRKDRPRRRRPRSAQNRRTVPARSSRRFRRKRCSTRRRQSAESPASIRRSHCTPWRTSIYQSPLVLRTGSWTPWHFESVVFESLVLSEVKSATARLRTTTL